ncbi:MAG: nicotinate phosphoribosyltransferase [Rhizomicrobium sp.]
METRGDIGTEGRRSAPVAVSPLLTDFYQLNMLQAYLDHGLTDVAVFEFFVRKMPANRGFLVAAGLEQAIAFLEGLRLSTEDLDWLRSTGRFRENLIDYLSAMRFRGDVHAVPEGTIVFGDEPILRITAPLPEAQLVETRLINILHYQTLIASKATRLVFSAPGKQLVDFGLRRAHGSDAGLMAARASYIAGFAGTATVLAEKEFGIPTFGTMAHSYIEAHDSEAEAFENFALARPDNLTLLIDTYDCHAAARKIVALAPRLKERGVSVKAVRIDSGDLAALSRSVRRILDEGGLRDVTIFASGGLDEYEIAKLIAVKAPIDGFGVGTALTVSSDAPALDCAYKLQEYAGRARRKHSAGKATWPGRKQVWRHEEGGKMAGDVIGVDGERQDGEALLVKVMEGGRRCTEQPSLARIRDYAARQMERLPPALRALEMPAHYPVQVSDALTRLAAEVDAELKRHS